MERLRMTQECVEHGKVYFFSCSGEEQWPRMACASCPEVNFFFYLIKINLCLCVCMPWTAQQLLYTDFFVALFIITVDCKPIYINWVVADCVMKIVVKAQDQIIFNCLSLEMWSIVVIAQNLLKLLFNHESDNKNVYKSCSLGSNEVHHINMVSQHDLSLYEFSPLPLSPLVVPLLRNWLCFHHSVFYNVWRL